jgi:hypothetical protein
MGLIGMSAKDWPWRAGLGDRCRVRCRTGQFLAVLLADGEPGLPGRACQGTSVILAAVADASGI